VQGAAVGFAEYGGSGDSEFAAGAEDANGDFAAIGNENFAKHTFVRMQRNFSMRAAMRIGAISLACLIVSRGVERREYLPQSHRDTKIECIERRNEGVTWYGERAMRLTVLERAAGVCDDFARQVGQHFSARGEFVL
jgi:hypothetical protein